MSEILKSGENGIGEYGVRQLSQCHWHNLSQLLLSNKRVVKIKIHLETLAANG